jgi:rubrerythrin
MTDLPKELPHWASTWERDLYAHIINHVQSERELLEEYVTAAEATESKALAYLVNLLIADERRHHLLFSELAAALKSDSELRAEDPAIPRMDFRGTDGSGVRELTNRLLKREQDDLRELKRLQKELRNVKDTTLWALLVDLMQRDTDKHIAILRFAQRHS